MSSKRARPSTPEADAKPSDTAPEGLSPKVKRTSISSAPIPCTLPPTCNPPNPPSLSNNTKDFEVHYATYHTHVCVAPETKRNPGSSREAQCGKVFPDARLLDLHFSECHDPLIEVRRDRGEKMFACFVESCKGLFRTPKGRRLHLIDIHKYPKEYYFSVTAKGVGDLLNRWGQGASLLRKEWKPRETAAESESDRSDSMEVDKKADSAPSSPDQSMSQDAPPPSAAEKPMVALSQNQLAGSQPLSSKKEDPSSDLDTLASNLSSLKLVPSSIRFGRGRGGALLGRGSKPIPKLTSGDAAGASTTTKVLGGGRKPDRGRGAGFRVVSKTSEGNSA